MSAASSISAFIRASNVIIKFEESFRKHKPEDFTLSFLNVQAKEIGELWSKVKYVHDHFLEESELEKNDKTTPEVVKSADAKYESTYNAYVRCLSQISDSVNDLRATKSDQHTTQLDSELLPGSHNVSNTRSINDSGDNFCSDLKLPPIEVPVFHGDYLSWPKFRDLFETVCLDNPSVSPIRGLLYLLEKTKGDAHDIVASFPQTHRSLDLAWKALTSAYDNPRLLVNNQLRVMFGLPLLEHETSDGLKTILRGISGCLSALATYEVPTNSWDPILVFLCIQRLPKATVELWEHSVKNKTSLPPWKDLEEFVQERIQTLECLRDLRGPDLSSSKKPQDKNFNSH